jgi:hypothetical protein
MSRTGAAAVLQSAKQENQGSGTTPAPVFGNSALTGNPTLGAVANTSNPATLTPPTGWTELDDLGITSPTAGLEYIGRNSGFTGTTVTWGSTSPTPFASLIIELDTTSGAVQYNQTLSASSGGTATSPKQVNKIVVP